jgi:hypothetical protein
MPIYFKSTFILFIISMALGCSGETKLTNSILNKKPVFKLMIHSVGTRYDVLLNGVMIYDDASGNGQITTSLPINHWMRSGENSLELVLYPDDEGIPINEKSEVNAEIYVHNDEIEEQQYRIGGFNFKGLGHIRESDLLEYRLEAELFKRDDEGEVIAQDVEIIEDTVFDGVIEYKQILTIPNSLPLWAFFNSDDVPNEPDLSEEEFWDLSEKIQNQLISIREHLVSGDVDEILPLFEERNNELDKAFYYSSGVMEAKLRDSFEVDIPQLDMLNIQNKHVAYENEENIKLASVYRKNKGAAISGNYKEGSGSVKFPIMFRKQDGQWIITR